jgi:pimeloyl-ACP methyl ester carboxylesterase
MTMPITATDTRLASGRPGLRLLLRNKRCADDAGLPVLCVHGATYPASVTFDYPVEGRSWLDVLAASGRDAWCVDLLGYGGSDRPAAMADDPLTHEPIVDTAEAVGDVLRAVRHICAMRGVTAIDLIGHSWGTTICGQVAASEPALVRRLVLFGALWINPGTVQIPVSECLGAYRLVDAAATVKRWTVNLDATQRAAIASEAAITAWAEAAVASDPEAARHDPPRLRAPTGVIKDVRDYWLAGRATYDPAAITSPTLVIVGEWDQETTPAQGQAVFSRLSKAAERRYTVVGAGTHLLLLERQRHQLYAAVGAFLGA